VRDDVRVTTLPQTTTDGAGPALALRRLGLVVHPKREIDGALDRIRTWTAEHGAELVQIRVGDHDRVVADAGDAASCDLVLAIGGDGTTLHALHAAAEPDRAVLGIACGSLGALTAVAASELGDALDRVAAGEWTPKPLPGVRLVDGDGTTRVALNDVVVVRQGAGQVAVEVRVDGEVYVRYAGDGIVVATPVGSSAYTLAAGGPILAGSSDGLVVTPIAAHGGCTPPLVVGPGSEVELHIEPGYGGARLEFDGQIEDEQPTELRLARVEDHATLVALGDAETLIAGLRRRRILIDSPRVLARDDRKRLGDAS